MRNSFIASVSKTAAKGFRDKIKALEIHKRTGCKMRHDCRTAESNDQRVDELFLENLIRQQ